MVMAAMHSVRAMHRMLPWRHIVVHMPVFGFGVAMRLVMPMMLMWVHSSCSFLLIQLGSVIVI